MRARRVLQMEASHQPNGDLLAREAHKIREGGIDIMLIQIGAQLSCGARVGERLQLLGLNQGAVEVEDERADHTRPRRWPRALPLVNVTFRYLRMLKLNLHIRGSATRYFTGGPAIVRSRARAGTVTL
jgi:hypothetical protein